jgi:outer membrane protein OmpA-like peptidoglycan-associated protein
MTAVRYLPIAGLAGLLLLASTGCATKKHVRTTIEPLENRIGQLENTDKQTATSITNLEQGVSRADERARGAESRASQAADAAKQANDRAVKSGEQAEAAARAAASAASQAEQVAAKATDIEKRMGALDDYNMVAENSVLFDFGKSELNDAAKQALDEMASKVQSFKRFVVEVQGYTDQVGAPTYNLELSRQRANAVLRYLTMHHKIPLHRIHIMGVGEEAPVADNKTRDGRKQNRRVEVRVYTADEALTGKKVEARLNGQ